MQKHGRKYFAPMLPPPKSLRDVVKIQHFQNMAMLHVKFKGMTHATAW